jgi:hypothetical protein
LFPAGKPTQVIKSAILFRCVTTLRFTAIKNGVQIHIFKKLPQSGICVELNVTYFVPEFNRIGLILKEIRQLPST